MHWDIMRLRKGRFVLQNSIFIASQGTDSDFHVKTANHCVILRSLCRHRSALRLYETVVGFKVCTLLMMGINDRYRTNFQRTVVCVRTWNKD